MDRVAAVALYISIVETGSFSKAAAEFSITQPTATKAVAAMEQRLGARLLHRTPRGVSPTEVGTLYYDRCKAIAHEIEAADNLATLMQSGVGGTLRVSTSVAFGRRCLKRPPCAGVLSVVHPDGAVAHLVPHAARRFGQGTDCDRCGEPFVGGLGVASDQLGDISGAHIVCDAHDLAKRHVEQAKIAQSHRVIPKLRLERFGCGRDDDGMVLV